MFEQFLPTSAMSYDGIFLEELIEGYQTLKVEGREMLSAEIEQQAIQVGAIVMNQTLPVRELKITYKLEDRNPETLQFKFKTLLNHLYRSNDVEIRFYDELDYYYYGRYTSAETVSGESNSVISSFTILCVDPLKYTKEFVTDGYVGIPTFFPVTPRKIEAVLSNNQSITITNGKQTISISDAPIQIGDKIVFQFAEQRVLVNGADWTPIIDLDSDFENFCLEQGQEIKSSNGTLKIYYRGATI
ncbi:distal tail protein Dit [Enterococcus thailandicus]|nr:distal tail protein Dit [Enterococcus thailandicus]